MESRLPERMPELMKCVVDKNEIYVPSIWYDSYKEKKKKKKKKKANAIKNKKFVSFK